MEETRSRKFQKEFGEVYTPDHIVINSINNINKEKLALLSKFCDPTCGTGGYLGEIIGMLMNHPLWKKTFPNRKKRYNYICENNIYGMDIQEKQVLLIKRLLDPENKLNLNIKVGDATRDNNATEDNFGDIKFYWVGGNPPYNNNLDKIIIRIWTKYLEVNGSFGFVMSANWPLQTKGKRFEKFLKKKGLKKIDFLPFSTFPGVDIATMQFHCEKNYNGNIKINDIEVDKKSKIHNFRQIEDKNIFDKIGILKKLQLYKGKNETLSHNEPKETDDIKFKKDEICKTPMLSRLSGGKGDEVYYIRLPVKTKKINKLIFPRGTASYNSKKRLQDLTRHPVYNKYIEHDIHISKGIVYFEVLSKKEADVLQWYLMESKFVRYLFLRYNVMSELTKGFVSNIPKIPLNGSIDNDNDLYKYFEFTEKEIKHIGRMIYE